MRSGADEEGGLLGEGAGDRLTVPAETVTMPDGAMLRLTTTGSGHPLVLCHGGPGLWDYLDSLAGLLDDMSLVHRYDQ